MIWIYSENRKMKQRPMGRILLVAQWHNTFAAHSHRTGRIPWPRGPTFHAAQSRAAPQAWCSCVAHTMASLCRRLGSTDERRRGSGLRQRWLRPTKMASVLTSSWGRCGAAERWASSGTWVRYLTGRLAVIELRVAPLSGDLCRERRGVRRATTGARGGTDSDSLALESEVDGDSAWRRRSYARGENGVRRRSALGKGNCVVAHQWGGSVVARSRRSGGGSAWRRSEMGSGGLQLPTERGRGGWAAAVVGVEESDGGTTLTSEDEDGARAVRPGVDRLFYRTRRGWRRDRWRPGWRRRLTSRPDIGLSATNRWDPTADRIRVETFLKRK
jgi:hypothetical protein